MVDIFKSLLERIEKAEEDMKILEELIETAKEAGEDVTEWEIKKDELKEKIEMWKKALAKRVK